MHLARRLTRVILGALLLAALAPGMASAIPRSEILARGKVWVDKHVPYSQTRYAYVGGSLIPTSVAPSIAMTKGYRTDCSGYISMCMAMTNASGQPISLSTRTFGSTLTTITKEAMLPGDVMLKVGTHVVLFVGWADSLKDRFIAYEEMGTKYGTVRSTTRTYSQCYSYGYRAYRYVQVDDYFADVEQVIYGATRYSTALAAANLTYPATATVRPRALVVEGGDVWMGNVAGASIAGAVNGPVLLTQDTTLTAGTASAIKRLKPTTVYLVGSASLVTTAVSGAIEKLGPTVVRVAAVDRYATAANGAIRATILARRAGRVVDTAYLVNGDSFADALPVIPITARIARPILLTGATKLSRSAAGALTKTGIKRVVVVGTTESISSAVVSSLKARGITVMRVTGEGAYSTSVKLAQHGVGLRKGLTWSRVGLFSASKFYGMIPCAVAQGQSGGVLMLNPATYLFPGVGAQLKASKPSIGKVRIYGNYSAIQQPVRAAVATIMRAK